MFWSKNILKSTCAGLLMSCIVSLQSCSETATNLDVIDDAELFDIPSFFDKEIASLKKANPKVLKSVSKDHHTEEKLMQIESWDNELSSFKLIDLRKGVYKGFVIKDSIPNMVTYSFQSDDVDLSKVQISYSEGSPLEIKIERKVNNLLYNTHEVLSYIVGKNYTVDKTHDVWILGENRYRIHGTIQ